MPQLPAVADLAASVRASRDEFNRVFLQAQVDYVRDPSQRQSFHGLIGNAPPETEAKGFELAFEHARDAGWLEALVRYIVLAGLENGNLARALFAEVGGVGDARLQAMTNMEAGFKSPEQWHRGVASAMRWTVKIVVNNKAKGTGVLIFPNLVLTTWHVVREAFHRDPQGKWEPNEQARIQVQFDDLGFSGTPGWTASAPQTVSAHTNWCVVWSNCHEMELNSRLPENLDALDGLWDYVIIRLAKAPGVERRWAALDDRAVVPVKDSDIIVFQHPAGQPLNFDYKYIVEPAAPETAIPRLRFLHKANTTGGSSGGPCFDKSFMLFGLHQGEWAEHDANGAWINRGVPVAGVLQHLRSQIRELPPPDPTETPVWQLHPADLRLPVIGCDRFQGTVWKSTLQGQPRIISVSGDAGVGKSYRLDVLAAMLPDGSDLKVRFDAATVLKMNDVEAVRAVCQAAGGAVPEFLSVENFASTASTWIKDELVQKTMVALDGVRAGRRVWLMLADFNKSQMHGEEISPLLSALLHQTTAFDWFRVVLDGVKGDLPQTLHAVTSDEFVTMPTLDDLTAYMKRAVVGESGQVPNDMAVAVNAATLMDDFAEWRRQDATTAMSRLAKRAGSIVRKHVELMGGG